MNFRRTLQMAMLCLAICFQAAAQVTPGSSFLFHLPLPDAVGSNSTRVLGYLADTADLNVDVDITGPANPTQIIPTPDGNRVYVVSNGTLQVFNTVLTTLTPVANVTGPIRNVRLTPDGKYLLVAGAQFYILNTSTNALAATNLGVSGQVADFAISSDSTKAWVLQTLPFNNNITPINLTTLTGGAKVSITRAGETISLSPTGKLYVPTRNVITEYDPTTLQSTNETQGSFLPGRLNFNLDGTKAYFIDKSEFQAFSIVVFNTTAHTTTGWPANIFTTYAPVFDEIYVAGPGRLFGLERSKSTLWEITDDPLGAAPVNMPAAFDSTLVFGAAVSSEIPSARYLYVLTESSARPTLARVALSNNTLQVFSNALVSSGLLRYFAIPPQTGASQIIKFNDAQTINGGGVAKTLLAYVTDSLGRPVYNQQVTFAPDSGSANAVLANVSARTNANGFVQADVTVPATPGTYTINLYADAASGSFTITVPGTTGGGGGGGGVSAPHMVITRGDGQLIVNNQASADWAPLTVRLVDANNKPVSNVNVDFGILQGDGLVSPSSALTNEFGLASTTYYTFAIPTTYAFLQTIIRASNPDYGSVQFSEIVYRPVDGQFIPISPNSLGYHDQVTVRRGDVIPNFFADERHSNRSPQIGDPIQGFGLRVGGAGDDFVNDGPGSCVNDTKSDNTGVSRCDFQASCSLTAPATITMVTGELFKTPMVIIPAPGSGQNLKYLSGNNQTANIGSVVGNRLVANLTDNCGDPVPNQNVTWTVTSGSATLTNTISKSGADGNVSTAVTLGQTAGTVKITLSFPGSADVVYTLTATVSVSSISLTSGGGQSVLPGQAFPSPLIFTLRTSNGNAVGANITANFSLSGSGTLSAASATTNAQGQVQVNVTAGAIAGPVTVTATYSNLSASASLTIQAPTLPLTAASFSNAASGVTGLTPCGLATAVGAGLVPDAGVISGISPFGPLPYQLGSIKSLTVNNVPAPIQAVSNQNGKQQVNFQVPCETVVGNATVAVNVNGVVTTVTGVPVLAGQPGIFTYAGPNNKLYGAVIRLKDGSYITPSNLAPTGEDFYLILTGLGAVTPATLTNSAGNNQAVNLTTVVGVNNAGVPTQTARYLTGSIGVYYVQFTIPKTSTVAPGTVLYTDTPLAAFVSVNNVPVFSQPGVLLPGVVQGQ
jgi:uncharacterized protein (TIGR03437 family)